MFTVFLSTPTRRDDGDEYGLLECVLASRGGDDD